jgi:dTDP-4-amino-4,6-dideoxygalactose transaminase
VAINSSPLAIFGGTPVIAQPPPHFKWPPINDKVRRAVNDQLERSISIYDRSGIFAKFESRFADYHARRYGLLHSSGTLALLAMYFGANLCPGDEVICPTYTFHATVSPLVLLGVTPVFCDCLPDGNIDPDGIAPLISAKTKAIVVTHMWGVPCDMDRIVPLARARGLLLFEDCSHAHGAQYQGRHVGTFGDAAAWSLQGPKTISGGEGGILLTDHEELFHRALVLGHYNKRCDQELPLNHPLRQFVLTGFGLKSRAHPLAIAIADCIMDDLDEILARRAEYAHYMLQRLSDYDCIVVPNLEGRKPSWYAFPFQYLPDRLSRVQPSVLHRAMHAEGLYELDRPKSTRPIHDQGLFRRPELAFAWLKPNTVIHTGRSFPQAEFVHEHQFKMPVWSAPSDRSVVQQYCDGIQKVLDNAAALTQYPE